MRQIHDSGCDMKMAKSGHPCQLCHYHKLYYGSNLKDNTWVSARPPTADGLVYKRHVCNESLTVTTLNRLEIFPGDGPGYFLVWSLDDLTLEWPLCVWQRARRSGEGGRRNSPVLQRVLCVFGGDLSRHWVQKRRCPVVVAVGAERKQKNVTFAL